MFRDSSWKAWMLMRWASPIRYRYRKSYRRLDDAPWSTDEKWPLVKFLLTVANRAGQPHPRLKTRIYRTSSGGEVLFSVAALAPWPWMRLNLWIDPWCLMANKNCHHQNHQVSTPIRHKTASYFNTFILIILCSSSMSIHVLLSRLMSVGVRGRSNQSSIINQSILHTSSYYVLSIKIFVNLVRSIIGCYLSSEPIPSW